VRAAGSELHGLQLWVALPVADEETEPAFHHHPAETLPLVEDGGLRVRVLAGSAYGATSPVRTFSPLFYVDAWLPAGGALPLPGEHVERAAYVVDGAVRCGGERVEARRLIVLARGATAALEADGPARVALLGGEPIGARHVWWNFVSSSRERIEQAKRDWASGRFPKIPGDEIDFIPLPES
jgi:redox-sensitive bicupin YhaK (pirin superfamily)